MSSKELRINDQIRVREVRLIDAEGKQMGVVAIAEALAMGQEAGLDLVEIAPQAVPPVCKILDYGKYRFELEKKNRESKKKQKLIKMKEIRMQPKIEEHDLQFKSKHVKEFLDEGNKVKVTIRFRGRELAHTERGKVVLEKVLALLDDSFVLEKEPAMEGRFMSMVVGPKGKK
ncbi:MAG: translation initiation factor IF-3 [Spirochaetales bacterium]|nr:translation initiation factor IF-3 [Spirochaetales bacterium]